MYKKICKDSASVIAAVWAGLILGVSFFAAPIKFTAEEVSREHLLLVGKVTFLAFTWIELGALLLLILTSLSNPTRRIGVGIGLLCLLFLIQKLGILPSLISELDAIVAGETVEKTSNHLIYTAIEAAKVVLLLIFSARLKNEKKLP